MMSFYISISIYFFFYTTNNDIDDDDDEDGDDGSGRKGRHQVPLKRMIC